MTPLPQLLVGADEVSVIPNLCPSNDLTAAGLSGIGWTFSYAIYTGDTCGAAGGDLLNTDDNAHNFVCFAASDLTTQANPNATAAEQLAPGINTNNVICTTVNAQKTFDFQSCAVTCSVAPGGMNVPAQPNGQCAVGQMSTFDCGCINGNTPDAPTNTTCTCGGVTVAAINPACTAVFNPLGNTNECAIQCPSTASPAGNFGLLTAALMGADVDPTSCGMTLTSANFTTFDGACECTRTAGTNVAAGGATCTVDAPTGPTSGVCPVTCVPTPTGSPSSMVGQVAAAVQALNPPGAAFQGFDCATSIPLEGMVSPAVFPCTCTSGTGPVNPTTVTVTTTSETFSCSSDGNPSGGSCTVSCHLLP